MALLLIAALTGRALGQEEPEDPALAGVSRSMKLAIKLFEQGEDVQAMDRFLEIMTHGEPAERAMANEYLNLISQRRSASGGDIPERPRTLRPNPARVEPVGAAATTQAPKPEVFAEPIAPARDTDSSEAGRERLPNTAAPVSRREGRPQLESTRGDPAVMKQEIRARLRGQMDAALSALRRFEDVRILMRENGEPQAIGIPSAMLFGSGIAFRKEAQSVLDALARLAFSLGGAQVVILPEGTAVGDAKVLDMRRTMGISAHLFTAGVAPPRVRINLLNSQVEIPRPLREFKGVAVVFVYDQPLALSSEGAVGDEAGPPISLGVYPSSLRADADEGAVIEFSVTETPAGLASWKFSLLQPVASDGRDLAPLQEVVGGGPVFHQIYWNGRQNYFGGPLPAGRYECVLTATDGKNRQRALHRWIQLLGRQEQPERAVAAPAVANAAAVAPAPAAAPAADFAAGKPLAAGLIKESPSRRGVDIKRPRRGKRRSVVKAAPAAPAAAADTPRVPNTPIANAEPSAGDRGRLPNAATAPATAKAAPPQSTRLEFMPRTHNLTPDAEKRLARLSEAIEQFPLEQLKVTGHAQSAEPEPERLAERRARMVAGLLVNKYQIEPKRVRVASAVSEAAGPSVLVELVKGQ